MSKNSKRCWEPGCTNKGIKCVIPGPLIDGDDEKSRYCTEHAAKNGFCYGCGIFCAGIESFSFGEHAGLCDNCADQSDAEWGDDSEWYEEAMDIDYLLYP
jgi:hypothetical protein